MSHLNPSTVRKLKAHEAATLSDTSDSDTPLVPLTPELAASLRAVETLSARESSLAAREAALAASAAALAHRSLIASLQRQCSPLTIGGRDGCAPCPDLDIVVEPDPFDASRQIAWIPVPLYPIPFQDPKNPYFTSRSGDKIPNYVLGETRINESLATATVSTTRLSPTSTPSSPSLLPTTVSLCGFARITVSRSTPEEVAARLTAREGRHRDESVSAPSDVPFDLTSEASLPPFIPSAVKDPTSRLSPTTSRTIHTS